MGTDLQSAAAAVLGYRQAPVKGRGIEVPPVREVATERLRALLRSALSGQVRSTPAGMCLPSAHFLLVGAGRRLKRFCAWCCPARRAPCPTRHPGLLQTQQSGWQCCMRWQMWHAKDLDTANCPTGMQEGPAAGPIEAMVEARRELRPALRGGSAACGGRLRCVRICLSCDTEKMSAILSRH